MHRSVIVTALFFFILLLPGLSAAQGNDLYFTRFTEKDGLSDNHITCFFQDQQGYMWIGTFFGLNKFDGYTVEHFTHTGGDSNTISGNYITSIAQDRNGILWIGTAKNGLNTYDPSKKKFTHYFADSVTGNALISNNIAKVFIDGRNHMWVGFYGQGWCVYDQESRRFSSYKSGRVKPNAYADNTHDIVEGFAEDGKGGMWIASNQGLYHQDGLTGSIEFYLDVNRHNNPYADNLFTCLYKAGDSAIWLGTWAAGIKKFTIKTHSYTQYLFNKVNPVYGINNIVLGITPKSASELWVATADEGLGVLNMLTGAFTFFANHFDNPNSPLSGRCNQVFADRQGLLWAGYNEGISRLSEQSPIFHFFPIYNYTQQYKRLGTNCLYKDTSAGLLYLGGEGGKGLYIVNENTGTQLVIPFPTKSGFAEGNYTISSIIPFDSEHLLVLAANGLNFYTNATKTIKPLAIKDQEGKPIADGYSLCKSSNGTWWYTAAYNGGCYRIDSSLTKAYHYYGASVPALKRLEALLYAEADTAIWINDNVEGLNVFNSINNTVKPIAFANHNFKISGVVTVKPLNNKEYLLTSYDEGLYLLTKNDNNTFNCTHFGEADGIPSGFMKGLIKDRHNNYWITSRKGPVFFSPQKKVFKIFGEEAGYKASKWLYEDAYTANDRYIYFTAVGGYVRADIDSLGFNQAECPLVLKSFKVLGKEWNDTVSLAGIKEIELPYNQNIITIEYVLLNYKDAQNNKYAYMLKGVDSGFVYCGNRRFVTYADLPPGKYNLAIKAANNYGVWLNNVINIAIIIRPPFWRTWLFYVLSVLCVSMLIFVGYRYHIGSIRKEEKLKTAFNKKVAEIEMKALRAQMNPHFIFNCLNSINRYIVKSDHVTASKYLTRFAKLIRLILDNSIADTTSLDKEIQLIQLYLEMEELRYDNKFSYRIETAETLRPEKIMIPSMLIQPYAENAIWHGLMHKHGKGHIFIRFKEYNENMLLVEIEDDGIGRKMSAELKSKNALKNKSYGMQITGDRIAIVNQLYNMQASVIVEDLLDEKGYAAGTKISLMIPFETAGKATPVTS